MLKILVLTDFSSGYSRRLLEGIIRYSREVGPWSFIRMPLYYLMMNGENGVVDFAKRWKADAIIAQLRDVNIDLFRSLDIPIIVQNYRHRNKNISNLTGDYYETGVLAADFFLGKGFRHFAYYGYKNAIWSRERALGYKERIEKHGYTCNMLENKNPDNKEWLYNTEDMGKWLEALPKPTALFACDDFYALQISETCNIYNISIPDDIAILGVDNDTLLCNLSTPTLSSIVLDVENGGYQAAKLLDQYIKNEQKEAFNIVVKPLYIENRASTDKYAVSDPHVKIVLDYITNNYNNKISVSDLVNLVPLSRRILEKKFKDQIGTSIYQCVLDHRINHFTKLLLTTNLHLPDAAIQVGFDDYKNVSRIFRKYKSMSPAEYRKLYRKQS
ncbi:MULTISPECIES: AraC family transcriptional regulator [Parabacteroides]|uniref:AraC family transcriptional regulator n=1 Tax=Parabacteroides provencensis TaxID=1944636 RepID=UPI000C1602DF|nr:DNA-binding transcriptional regulator [Parabacteroides provencensis]